MPAPIVSKLAEKTHFVKSTLQAACRGRVPPIPQVLDAFVLACGEDPQSWRRYVAAATASESAVITEADNRDPAVSGAGPNGAAPEAAAVTVDVIVADPGVPDRAHGRTARTRAIVIAMSAGVVTIAMVVCAVVFFGTKAPATSPRNLARSNEGVPTWSSCAHAVDGPTYPEVEFARWRADVLDRGWRGTDGRQGPVQSHSAGPVQVLRADHGQCQTRRVLVPARRRMGREVLRGREHVPQRRFTAGREIHP